MTIYVETSAAAKLLVKEQESRALVSYLDALAEGNTTLVSSFLLETELRRLAARHDLSQADVTEVLDRLDLFEPDRAIYTEAGLLPGRHLRSLDALHVAVAVRAQVTAMISYDIRQIEAARGAGLRVVTPA